MKLPNLKDLKIDFIGAISNTSNDSMCLKNLMKCLAGIADLSIVGFQPTDITNSMTPDDVSFIMQHVKGQRSTDMFIHAMRPHLWHPAADAYNIGVILWPTSKIPDKDISINGIDSKEKANWVKQCNLMDEIWTFGKTSKAAVEQAGCTKPVHQLAIPIDTAFWCPDAPLIERGIQGVTYDHQGNKIDLSKRFVVGGIADWEQKNDMDTFICCALLSVPRNNGVVVLKTHDYIGKQDIIDTCRKIKARLVIERLPALVVIDEEMTDEDLRGLIATFDVFLSTSRAEAVNLPLMYAMSMGKPVIAGSHSGHMDCMTTSNSVLVPVNLEIVRTDVKDPWYQADQMWGKINEVIAIQSIQNLHQKYLSLEGETLVATGAREAIETTYGMPRAKGLLKKRLGKILKNDIRTGLDTEGDTTDVKTDVETEVPSVS